MRKAWFKRLLIFFLSLLIISITGFALALLIVQQPLTPDQVFLAAVFLFVLSAGLAIPLTLFMSQPLRNILREIQSFNPEKQPSDEADDNELDEVDKINLAFIRMNTRLNTQISQLKAEQTRLEAVLKNMTDGILIVNSEGKIQLINPSAQQLFGFDPQEARGRSLIELVRQHQINDLWTRCRETRTIENVMLETIPDRHTINAIAIPLQDPIPESTLIILQDLTRVRHLETVRRDFVSNVSHELRTPLASLKALTETLREGALEDPPAARRFLERMENEIDNLTQMVQELLELSRIESRRAPLEKHPVAPFDLIHQSIERINLQAERAGLKMVNECPHDVPKVLVDPGRMQQVLINLLHNAIKFTPSGGQISVDAWVDQDNIVFSVRDTGVGIDPDLLERIFERFYKADRARSGGGTGLGLSIARHLVEAHGGQIWADSQSGKGSNFMFTVPQAKY